MPLVKSNEITVIRASGVHIEKSTIRNILRMGKSEWLEIIELLKDNYIGDPEKQVKFNSLYSPYKLKNRIPVPLAMFIVDYCAPDLFYTIKRG